MCFQCFLNGAETRKQELVGIYNFINILHELWEELLEVGNILFLFFFTTENVTEINLRKYQKTLLEKSELLKNLEYEIIDLTDKEEVDRINFEADSSSKQTEVLLKF